MCRPTNNSYPATRSMQSAPQIASTAARHSMSGRTFDATSNSTGKSPKSQANLDLGIAGLAPEQPGEWPGLPSQTRKAITLNPAVAARTKPGSSLGLTGCEESGYHQKGDLRRSWKLPAAKAVPGRVGDELPDLGSPNRNPEE